MPTIYFDDKYYSVIAESYMGLTYDVRCRKCKSQVCRTCYSWTTLKFNRESGQIIIPNQSKSLPYLLDCGCNLTARERRRRNKIETVFVRKVYPFKIDYRSTTVNPEYLMKFDEIFTESRIALLRLAGVTIE